MRCLSFFLAAALATVPRPATANPVATEVAEHFNVLVAATAARHCPDYDALVRDFGRFGLDLLTDKNRAAIGANFDRFAGILVEAQRPGHQLSHDIELLFIRHADEKQQQAYRDALLAWVVEGTDVIPPTGSLKIELTGRERSRHLLRHRARAADMLVDFGDDRVAESLDALLEHPDVNDKICGALERTRARLKNSCGAGAIAFDAANGLSVCLDASDIASLRVNGEELDRTQIDRFAALLAGATWLPARPEGGCCRGNAQIELANGVRLHIQRGREDGWFSLRETNDVNPRRQWLVACAALWDWPGWDGRVPR